MKKDFEKVLAYHCGPALAGIKTGNLISCSKKKYPDFRKMIRQYQKAMCSKGIRFEILHECSRNYLLFMYRETVLQSDLDRKDIQSLLSSAGYPVKGSLEEILEHLKMRLFCEEEFPHEIGVFLGYPPADILGFRENRGKNYKFCGHWKVYGDVEEAKKRFQQFDKCRSAICRRVSEGISLSQIFCSA